MRYPETLVIEKPVELLARRVFRCRVERIIVGMRAFIPPQMVPSSSAPQRTSASVSLLFRHRWHYATPHI